VFWKAVYFLGFVLVVPSTAPTVAEERAVAEEQPGYAAPQLPLAPYRYADRALPRHLHVALPKMDNTPAENAMTDAGATLGRVLFYDKQLSKNNSIACASCHLQANAFADPRQFSLGFNGGHTTRNAMGLSNLAFTILRGKRPGFFWDERAPTLEAQVLMPIQDDVEMGMELAELERKLQARSYYPALFDKAFGSPQVTSDRIAKAVAQFMRSLVSFESKFDRAAAAMAGQDSEQDFDDFTREENLGKSLFINGAGRIAEIGCAHCHIPPTFGMPTSFNNGLDLNYVDQGLGARDVAPNDPFSANNNGKFKAPSLRNIALTAPYMHDGRFKTLEQVIEHYSSGVHPHENVAIAFAEGEDEDEDEKTSGFHLTDRQKSALVAFLKTLTDNTLMADPRFSDPFTDH
jgi:cytochrome c peroxidase